MQDKKEDILISIVIPTFNVGMYIGECLNSILYQVLIDFEVIVVDDLSTDSTVDIVNDFVERDNRIKLFRNTRKMGSGGSRNFGMSRACGKYILFVDGDDWLDVGALESLYIFAEEFNTDMVMFKAMSYDDSSKSFFKDDYLTVSVLDRFNNKLFNIGDICDELFKISVVSFNKLYLRSFLEDIGASFPERYIHQDNPFFYQVFCAADMIFFADEFFYNRRVWKGSITARRDDTELGTIEIVEEILKVFLDNGFYDRFRCLLLNRLLFKLRNRYRLVGDDFKKEYYVRAKDKLHKFMFDYDLYDDLFECLEGDNRFFFNSVIYSKNFDDFLEYKD